MSKKVKRLRVETPQGEAGYLTHEARYVFNYTAKDPAAALSLAMPIRAESYADTNLPRIFEMNRPEGILLQNLKQKLLKFGAIDDMRIMSAVGDNMIGRIRLVNEDLEDRVPHENPMTLEEMISSGNSQATFEHLLGYYVESGVSGVQPKLITDNRLTAMQPTLIVKTSGEQWPELVHNEFLCMTAAQNAGLEVPEFWMSDDHGMFIMKRFDRVKDGQGGTRAIGFEDMCVLMGKNSTQKYTGDYKQLAKVLHYFCGDNALESCQRLFEYVALSVMVRNGDAHLKNFGLTYDDPTQTPRLSPLYDVVTTSVYNLKENSSAVDLTMALKIDGDRRYPTRDALIRFGKEVCHVSKPEAVLDRIAFGMGRAMQDYGSMMSKSMHAKMKDQWGQANAYSERYEEGLHSHDSRLIHHHEAEVEPVCMEQPKAA